MSARNSTLLSALALQACLVASVAAQPAAIDTAGKRQAMEKLAFIVGDWEGEATASLGPGRQVRLWQTEWVRPKLRGQILAVEGVGRLLTSNGPTDTLFNAWAVIDWAPARGYFMRSNVLDGRTGEFPLEVTTNGFVWGFEVPGGKVRYTMVLTPDNLWHEKGEFSRDGERWFPTMEMKLKRRAPTP
jgi:hypothetical protein